MKKKIDATKGALIPLIFSYAIPLILTTIIQQLFDLVDKGVLGNMADTTAVASVGATGTVTALVINGFVGLTVGTTVVLSRYIGQRNEQKIRETIDTSLMAGFFFGVLVAIIGVAIAPAFLRLTNCPSACYDGALLYIRIYISAAPATLLYNYSSAILRALGDTRRPMIYILISGVSNCLLNIVLCLILPEKVAAVAIATAASQVIAAGLALNRLCHFEDHARVSLKRFCPTLRSLGQIIRFGVPSAISNLILPIANLQIVSAINSFGVEAVAGQSASAAINNIAHAVTGGFGATTTVFMGQNIGAEKKERVNRSFWYCLALASLIGGFFGYVTYLTGRFWLGLVVGFSSTAAIEYGMLRMFYVAQFMFVNGINSVFIHALQAYGYPIFGSLSSLLFTLGFRVFWMRLIYPQNPTYEMIMSCFTASWLLNMLFFVGIVTIVYRRYNRGLYKKI